MTGKELAQNIAPPDILRQIITGQDEAAVCKLDETAQRIGKKLADLKFTTSQIRIIFSQVRVIEQDTFKLAPDDPLPIEVVRPLRMLVPKLAYQYGRSSASDDAESNKEEHRKKAAMGLLQTILSDAIRLVETNQRYFHNFTDFFEAILAYHRYHGGKS